MLKVIPPGLEPGTYSLEDCCSIQLSYGTKSTECLNLLKDSKCKDTVFYQK